MANYIVLSAKSGPDKDPDAIFVRDGFSMTAAIFPLFWLIWHRMWIWAAWVLLACFVASAVTVSEATEVLGGFAIFSICLFFGLEGRQLYVNGLIKRGFTITSVLDAPDIRLAETLYFQGAPMVFSRANPKPNPTVGKNLQGVGIFDSYGGI